VTVKVIAAVWLRLPDTPLTVMVVVPTAAALLTFRVSMLEPVVTLGLNEAVTPFGRAEADKLTLELKLLSLVTVIVLVPLFPRPMLRLLGEADKLNSGAAADAPTVKLTDVV